MISGVFEALRNNAHVFVLLLGLDLVTVSLSLLCDYVQLFDESERMQ